jgi:GTP-binding protein HflX
MDLYSMIETQSTANKPLRAYLVGVRKPGEDQATAEDHLRELTQLSDTFGVEVLTREVVPLRQMNAAYYLGEGKAQEIKAAAVALDADVIIFDDDLSPSQQRNWEKLTKKAVIDRREVILGIFADRAQTREARLQVELARAEYSLPRLTRAWTHLERQRGGTGGRGGAGESQLEVDRRLLRLRIDKLKRDLKHVRQVRATQRQTRLTIPIPTAALVGYTNAGKSSLLNALTGAGVYVADQLFATLDPTTRRITLPNNQPLLVTDTVGFVRKLPHSLVEAFKATLEEATLANVLLHVVDCSHPGALEQKHATEEVLKELGALDRPTILVLNKVDRLAAPLEEVFADEEQPGSGPAPDGAPSAAEAEIINLEPVEAPTSSQVASSTDLAPARIVDFAQPDGAGRSSLVPGDRGRLAPLMEGHPYHQVVLTSAVTGEGIPRLLELIAEMAPSTLERIDVTLPPDRGDLFALLHREGHVESVETHEETGDSRVVALLPRKFLAGLESYRRTGA